VGRRSRCPDRPAGSVGAEAGPLPRVPRPKAPGRHDAPGVPAGPRAVRRHDRRPAVRLGRPGLRDPGVGPRPRAAGASLPAGRRDAGDGPEVLGPARAQRGDAVQRLAAGAPRLRPAPGGALRGRAGRRRGVAARAARDGQAGAGGGPDQRGAGVRQGRRAAQGAVRLRPPGGPLRRHRGRPREGRGRAHAGPPGGRGDRGARRRGALGGALRRRPARARRAAGRPRGEGPVRAAGLPRGGDGALAAARRGPPAGGRGAGLRGRGRAPALLLARAGRAPPAGPAPADWPAERSGPGPPLPRAAAAPRPRGRRP
jgi:hypothetical protein